MKIRFIKDWRLHRAGDEMEMGGGVADILIQRGFARATDEVECAAVEAPEAAVIGRPRKRRPRSAAKKE